MVNRDPFYPSLCTPSVLIDMDKLEANIKEMSQLSAEAGVRLRPHSKVHQSAEIAKMQIEAGACGIETGSLEQAEAMASEGLDDIVVAHPFYGIQKIEKLRRLLNKPNLKITVVVDMIEQAESISQIGQAINRKIPALIKLDTNTSLNGIPRFGVAPGKTTLDFIRKLNRLSGIYFAGIYAHEMMVKPTPETVDKIAYETALLVTDTVSMLKQEGYQVEHASVGASATYRSTCRYIKEGKFPDINEIHPGTCVIGDITQVGRLAMKEDKCALSVITSVISTSHLEHVIIDAGSKTFGADPLIGLKDSPGFFWKGKPSYGLVVRRPDLWLGYLSAETGIIYYKDQHRTLNLGDRIQIIPNNAIVVINLHEKVYGIRNGVVDKIIPITGRGWGS